MSDEKIIRDAQYRKGLSIAFFNATNSAISMLTADKINMTSEEMEAYITKWRTWFLDTHKEYYVRVIANVGANYHAKDSIEKLEATNNLEELRVAWVLLSADERADGEIRKVANDLKKKYEKK